jgi:hypothetical protein
MSFFDSPEYSSGILAQRLAIDAAQVNQGEILEMLDYKLF